MKAVSRRLAEVAGILAMRKPFSRTAAERTVTGRRKRQVGLRQQLPAVAA